jgi:hypothetical protein
VWEKWISWNDSNWLDMTDDHLEDNIAASIALGKIRRAVRFAARATNPHEMMRKYNLVELLRNRRDSGDFGMPIRIYDTCRAHHSRPRYIRSLNKRAAC